MNNPRYVVKHDNFYLGTGSRWKNKQKDAFFFYNHQTAEYLALKGGGRVVNIVPKGELGVIRNGRCLTMNNIDEKQASKLPLFASLDPGTQLNIFETLLFLDAQLSKQNKNKRVLRLDDSDTELPSMEALAAYIIASRKYRAEET